ncbi:MAG: ABC transporter substrate-binding protein [Propylenella sp.]
MRRSFLALPVAVLIGLTAVPASAQETIRIGVLEFGTVNWEVDTIIHNKLDEANGFKLEPVILASNDATRIAINAGEVDVIVSDWLFVSRQRAEGLPLTMVPFSTSVGAIMVPPDSTANTLADLKGKKIGVAGGPLDKTWLMYQGLAKDQFGFDLAAETEPAFGAPPLLMEKLLQGELDATSNFWNFNARLEVQGYREIVTGAEAAAALGATGAISAIGYVFNEEWANEHKDAMLGFVKASRQAKELLASSDAEWDRLRPLMRIDDDAVFKSTVRRFREGIPNRPIAEEEADTAKVYDRLAALGGEELVGPATTMAPGTFWTAAKEGM